MTEHAEELGHNPSRLFTDGRAAKQAHREHLADVLTGPAQEQPEADALAERIATMIGPVIDAAVDAVLSGRADGPPAPAPAAPGFDGGARENVPLPPPTHDEFLVTLIRQSLADRGANF